MPFATYVDNAWRSVTIIIAILGVELNALGLEDIFWATLAPEFHQVHEVQYDGTELADSLFCKLRPMSRVAASKSYHNSRRIPSRGA
jgi:hypothetical protein